MNQLHAKPLPENLEAEQYVLGAVICDPNVIFTATSILSEYDFITDPYY